MWKVDDVKNEDGSVSTELLTVTTPEGKTWIVEKSLDPRMHALALGFRAFQDDPPVFTVCAGKLEEDEGEVYTNWKYISEPMTLAAALEDVKKCMSYPVYRIEHGNFVVDAEPRTADGI